MGITQGEAYQFSVNPLATCTVDHFGGSRLPQVVAFCPELGVYPWVLPGNLCRRRLPSSVALVS